MLGEHPVTADRLQGVGSLAGYAGYELGADAFDDFRDQEVLGLEVSQRCRVGDSKRVGCRSKGQAGADSSI